MIFMESIHIHYLFGGLFMPKTVFQPDFSGSLTPDLEGAPRSDSHENRNKSVISPPKPAPAREGELS
jgi:hypothetical protein